MQNLIQILIKYHNFWLFLLLQGICFFLIIQYHQHHRAVFFDAAYQVSGSAFDQKNRLVTYFRLQKINDSLMRENARLREIMPNAFYSNMHRAGVFTDSLMKQQYEYIPTRIINNSVHKPNNYFTLDRGSSHDVSAPAGLITNSGVAGIVTNVSAHFSSGMSVLHQDFTLSVQIIESGYIGSLIWGGREPETLTVTDIPRHQEVREGQTVVTSPYSKLFPRGIPVGTIRSYELDPVSNFYRIKVDPSVSFRDMTYGYIITNVMADEQISTEREARQW